MKVCYYKILGVPARASQEEIKRAFRLLALRLHPDCNPLDPEANGRFRQILEAYETLSDATRRARYDTLRGYRRRPKRTPGLHREEAVGTGDSFQDIFKEAFGVQFEAPGAVRGSDLRFDLQVPRSVAARGAYERIRYERRVFCPDCCGNGRRVPLPTCGVCHGSGELEELCSLRVWIPAGVSQGARLRIAGAGDRPSAQGRAGDLVILLHVVENG